MILFPNEWMTVRILISKFFGIIHCPFIFGHRSRGQLESDQGSKGPAFGKLPTAE